MKKIKNVLALLPLMAVGAFAEGASIVTLPATFADDAKVTLTTAFGVILSVLVVVWVIRKLIKTTNRS